MPKTANFLKNSFCYFINHRVRKNQRAFLQVMDYRYYFRLLKKYKANLNIRIFAFCLLPETIYLIAQPQKFEDLASFIQKLNQAYAFYFNSRYHMQEKLFYERYKHTAIRNDLSLVEHIKFIEFIPVKCQMTDTPVKYPWSSCSYRIGGEENGILDTRPWPKTLFEDND